MYKLGLLPQHFLSNELGFSIDPKVFEDPVNSEIYAGVCESSIGNLPLFKEIF